MRSRLPGTLVVLAVLLPGVAGAIPPQLDYFVPSIADPTIQAAVAHAGANPATLSVIYLTQSPIHTNGEVLIGAPFTPAQSLLIRPLAALGRATVIGDATSEDIFRFDGGGGLNGGATLQDLDILREVTNNHHLIEDFYGFTDLLIQRCRIGSTHLQVGTAGWNYIELENPVNVTIQNCILFASKEGTFERGIHVSGFPFDAGSLRLYNNTITDYGIYGIHLEDAAIFPVTFLLRNNVVANSPAFAAVLEPTAFRSDVTAANATVVSGGNATFTSAGLIQSLAPGAKDLLGVGLDTFTRAQLGSTADNTTAFRQRTWIAAQGYDANPLLFHLWPNGCLHDGLEDVGQVILNAAPDPLDVAVLDDIDGDPRPAGADPGHFDRGADQVDVVGVGVAPRVATATLHAAPLGLPARELGVQWSAGASGRLTVEVFDVEGRRILRDVRDVSAGERGTMSWGGSRASGIYVFRATLRNGGRRAAVVSGRIVLVH